MIKISNFKENSNISNGLKILLKTKQKRIIKYLKIGQKNIIFFKGLKMKQLNKKIVKFWKMY